jgi:protein involved in polysaccharide export with SLBB domain
VAAKGSTLRELEQKLTRRLEGGFVNKPYVTVEIAEYRPFFILGEVNNPGSYPYKPGLSALNAVAVAGGYTYRARTSGVSVARENGDKGSLLPADSVQPGDVITVPERVF